MDLITFIQASTVNAPKETPKSSPSKQEVKADFAQTLTDTTEKHEQLISENNTSTDVTTEKIKSVEEMIVSIIEELGIELESITETDLTQISELLFQAIGKNLSEFGLKAEGSQENMLLALLTNGLVKGDEKKPFSKEKALALQADNFFEGRDEEKISIATEVASVDTGQKSFLSELVSLMDQNVDKEAIRKFLESNIDQLKNISVKAPSEEKAIKAESPIVPTDYEFTKKSEIDPILTDVKIINPNELLNPVDPITETTIEAIQLTQIPDDELIQKLTEQSASFNENRLKKVIESPVSDKLAHSTEDIKYGEEKVTEVSSELGQGSDDFFEGKEFTNQKNSSKMEQGKPIFEGGFQSELRSEISHTESSVFSSQVNLNSGLETKPISELAKTETLRYTTPVEFV